MNDIEKKEDEYTVENFFKQIEEKEEEKDRSTLYLDQSQLSQIQLMVYLRNEIHRTEKRNDHKQKLWSVIQSRIDRVGNEEEMSNADLIRLYEVMERRDLEKSNALLNLLKQNVTIQAPSQPPVGRKEKDISPPEFSREEMANARKLLQAAKEISDEAKETTVEELLKAAEELEQTEEIDDTDKVSEPGN